MKRPATSIILVCLCFLFETGWQCDSEESGSLLDSPAGVSQDAAFAGDIYIEDCVISGFMEEDGKRVVNNETALTASCYAGNLSSDGVEIVLSAFISKDNEMDSKDDYCMQSDNFTIDRMQRKKIELKGISPGNEISEGLNYLSMYVSRSPDEGESADADNLNNWSQIFEFYYKESGL